MQQNPSKFYIAKLIFKSIAKIITKQEKEDINKWLLQDQNKALYNKITDRDSIYQKLEVYKLTDSDKIYKRLEHQILLDQKAKSKLRYLKIFRYAAAVVVIGILATSYFFKDNLFSSTQDNNVIIVNNKINVGGPKATLTLEDGSEVVLEKGNSYQMRSAQSNGEQIIYKAEEKKSAKIAYNYLTIPRGGEFFIKLSDGTQVWLNSESQLKYPVNFKEGKTRQVELVYGEAYFDVSPSYEHNGSKFKVLNQSQEIEVLGTEFNLKAYKDEMSIYTTLVEGKVSVITSSGTRVLEPTEQANLNLSDSTISVSTVNVYNEVSWKENVFSFRRKPLKEIMKVLSRWYDIDVIFVNPDLEEVGFNGALGKDQKIEEILESIKNFGIIKEYEINDKTVVLK